MSKRLRCNAGRAGLETGSPLSFMKKRSGRISRSASARPAGAAPWNPANPLQKGLLRNFPKKRCETKSVCSAPQAYRISPALRRTFLTGCGEGRFPAGSPLSFVKKRSGRIFRSASARPAGAARLNTSGNEEKKPIARRFSALPVCGPPGPCADFRPLPPS